MAQSTATVLGVDGWKSSWLGAMLGADGGITFAVRDRLSELVSHAGTCAAVVVDVPIGTPVSNPRQAEAAARAFVGPRRSSVFPVPPEPVLRAGSYAEALDLARRSAYGKGISRQAYALREKIFEAKKVAEEDPRVVEGHPEVSFAEMNGAPLDHSKRSWNGHHERLALLAGEGLRLPQRLPADVGKAPVDDILDAVAMAWTARRVAGGESRTLPDPPEMIEGRQVAIWY